MKTNPGGIISVPQVIGRESLAQRAWEILDTQSIQMTAERRIGKTSLIRKMVAEAPKGWVPISQDLEKVHTAGEFAQSVYAEVEGYLTKRQRLASRTRKFLQDLGGKEIGNVIQLPSAVVAPWKSQLSHVIEDLVEQQSPDRVVFFWDEVPYMLGSIVRRDGERMAMEVLDVLRELRQRHNGFRMVVTGSIGLHHVIGDLKKSGYANVPFNDVYQLEVPPLAEEDARELAVQLIQGEALASSDLMAAAQAIAASADNVPFYVHHIVRYLKLNGAPAEPDKVARAVESQLLDANDPWELGHYRDRLSTYYPQDHRVAIAVLDTVAVRANGATVDDLLREISSQIEFDDRNRLLALLRQMEQDHYLDRTANGYGFRFPLIGRWWKLDRQLG